MSKMHKLDIGNTLVLFTKIESKQYHLEWSVKRLLSKTNYHIQADAVLKHILPQKDYTKEREWLTYAEETDLLNVTLFKCTAEDWREANLKLAKKRVNN